MPALDELFTQVENYPKMTMDYLLVSFDIFAPLHAPSHQCPSVLCWHRVARCVPARADRFPTSITPLLSCLVIELISLSRPPSQFSKIGKVMRHIHVLTDEKVPRDAEFKFRERAKVLVDKWHDILKATDPPKPATNGARKAADADDAPVANGKLGKDESGKDDADADAANGAGDESMLADVTMSEAA